MYQKMLNALADWIVLRQEYPTRKITLKVWCEYNWPEATETDIENLFNDFPKLIGIKEN